MHSELGGTSSDHPVACPFDQETSSYNNHLKQTSPEVSIFQ